MAYVGPAGLIGRPDEREESDYLPYSVEGASDITCWMHKNVIEHLKEVKPTREGDYLFACEGAGRLRFRFCDAT
ncbi:trimethylamine--corrinoid methyltransferase [Acetomicrobium sp.]|uniref:trimethylamine--corrinoid methyltransferase n=1 Tax=Acetomicrobium sp. TaxID=1872099 RepID=UPI00287166C8|nr:trimethylamine--corrinoid methyltransferase [Acetomicrobium sp.]MDR9770027.1 trimethylamine--corrinoid methyltransferase [Acetomicrobium sp.]